MVLSFVNRCVRKMKSELRVHVVQRKTTDGQSRFWHQPVRPLDGSTDGHPSAFLGHYICYTLQVLGAGDDGGADEGR